ncbi:MAG TPA: hypothetical protein DGU45_01740, partial [Planctomycetes bacterium]|nr:hypothetical protein [Planctomycetota bacterium]
MGCQQSNGFLKPSQDFSNSTGVRVASKDRYRRLIGEVAQEMGFVEADAIQEALSLQNQLRSEGRKVPLLGQLLVELNHLTTDQLQQLIEIIYPVEDADSPPSAETPE